MQLRLQAFLLAVAVSTNRFTTAEEGQDIVSLIISGRQRKRGFRSLAAIGGRTAPDFASRQLNLSETVESEVDENGDKNRKLSDGEEKNFWELYTEDLNSYPERSSLPSGIPSYSPSEKPSVESGATPSSSPSEGIVAPSIPPVAVPSLAPVIAPAIPPTIAPAPTVAVPTNTPVAGPTVPTTAPVVSPTVAPVLVPTTAPVVVVPTVTIPTAAPIVAPTAPLPTAAPIVAPTAPLPTAVPAVPTAAPISGPPVVLQVIQPVALQGGAEFADPNSYQSKALARTEQQVGITTMTPAKIIQYYALYCIYNATNQVPNVITQTEGIVQVPAWIVATGWDSTTIDPCSGQWFGIACVNNQVTTIDLFSNLLTGNFPPEVTLLASDGERSTGAGALTRIDLFDNMLLTNNGDNSWWSLLGSSFGFLYFKDTGFSGTLARLPANIKEFDCSFSFISGGLNDANFQGLNSLTFADFNGNAYNSSMPLAFASLPALTFLYAVDGFISGDLSYMIGMPAMREHWVDTNPGLGGPLPAALASISTLESFSISSCAFAGTVPNEFGNWGASMKQLWMYDNLLTGTIPTQLGLLVTMKLLQLEGNSFVGSMPAEVCANTVFPRPLETLGADCFDPGFSCDCCTCCSVLECPV